MIIERLLDAMHLKPGRARMVVGAIVVALLVSVATVFIPRLFGIDVSPALTSGAAAAAYTAVNAQTRRTHRS
jgi:hypothetical protein